MTANLTPQYLAAEQRFKEATTTQEKLERLEEMLAVIPKHKGTEKLQAELKRKLAKVRAEAERGKHGASRASAIYTVLREGAGQGVLVGPPNVGKSSLLAALTHATPEIGDYPFTTRIPQPGMMPYENIQIQLVDLPPVVSRAYEPWIGGIIRAADLILLVVDLSNPDVLEEVEDMLHTLETSRIRLSGRQSEKEEESCEGFVQRPAFLVANKSDHSAGAENLPIVDEFFAERFDILPVSARYRIGLDSLRRRVFEGVEVIRVYTKAPGKKVDLNSVPFVLKRGSTVLDAARAVHRDFANTLKFARVWSSERSRHPLKFNGQMVDRNDRLEDEDILELHV